MSSYFIEPEPGLGPRKFVSAPTSAMAATRWVQENAMDMIAEIGSVKLTCSRGLAIYDMTVSSSDGENFEVKSQ